MTRLLDGLRNALALFGGAALLSILWFYAVLWYEARTAPGPALATPVSPVARKLAGRLTPGLQAAAEDFRPTFLRDAGGPVARFAAGVAYPVLVREIPRGAEIGCDHLLSHFGSMPLADLVELVVDHATAKGEGVHPSLRRSRR